MRQRVTIELLVETRDPFGQMIPSWVAQGTYWAHIETLSGMKVPTGTQVQAQTVHRVHLRYLGPAVTVTELATMRLTYRGRVFNIMHSEDVDFRHVEHKFVCREVTTPT
jgi:SPP1 family predicted phage head-tail adaptor